MKYKPNYIKLQNITYKIIVCFYFIIIIINVNVAMYSLLKLLRVSNKQMLCIEGIRIYK